MQMAGRRAFDEAIFVRLFRLWAMGQESQTSPIPAMHEVAVGHGYADQTSMACASLFELVQSQLGRALQRECCCSQAFSPDEKALLGILSTAPELPLEAHSSEIPNGLPGAISWAAASVCDAMELRGKRRHMLINAIDSHKH